MNFLIIKMQNKSNQNQKEIKTLGAKEVKKNDKIFCVRRNKIFYIGKILK